MTLLVWWEEGHPTCKKLTYYQGDKLDNQLTEVHMENGH